MKQQRIDKVCRVIFPQREHKKICSPTECNLYPTTYKNCHIAEKTDNQLKYILSSKKDNILLKACPGSGKTEVIGLKAAYEFQLWKYKNNGIAILTFTNNAANTIRERVQQFAGIGKTTYPHFIGTIDSWLHGYLSNPFGSLITGYESKAGDKSIKVVEDNISDGWIKNYKCKTSYYYEDKKGKLMSLPLYANNIRFDVENKSCKIKKSRGTEEYLLDKKYFVSEAFQKFILDKKWLTLKCMRNGFFEVKQKFWHDGFATYCDIECICHQLLKKHIDITQRLSQRFPLIIIDECQDLSLVQLEIFKFLIQFGTSFHFVGDLNQAIYEFKKVNPKEVEKFAEENKFERLNLSDNFRSCQPIVDLCQKIVKGEYVISQESPPYYQSCVCIQYKKDEVAILPDRFEKHLRKEGINTDKSAILARGWSMVNKLNGLDKKENNTPQFQMAKAIYLYKKYKNGNDELMDEALKYLGEFLVKKYYKGKYYNVRQYFCPKIVESPMRWRIFLLKILEELIKKDYNMNDLTKNWKEWAACVRRQLNLIVRNFDSILQCTDFSLKKIEALNFNSPRNLGEKRVIDTLSSGKKSYTKILITTIHKAKGKTFEAVLLVSNSQKGNQGGHWEEWLKDASAESARISYVASSRPKKLLVWAIPETKDLVKIKELGFHIE